MLTLGSDDAALYALKDKANPYDALIQPRLSHQVKQHGATPYLAACLALARKTAQVCGLAADDQMLANVAEAVVKVHGRRLSLYDAAAVFTAMELGYVVVDGNRVQMPKLYGRLTAQEVNEAVDVYLQNGMRWARNKWTAAVAAWWNEHQNRVSATPLARLMTYFVWLDLYGHYQALDALKRKLYSGPRLDSYPTAFDAQKSMPCPPLYCDPFDR